MKSFVFATVLATVVAVAWGQQTQTLEPFSSIVVCGNIPVGIQPSSDNTYSVEFQGDETQFSSLQAVVQDGVVYAQNPGSVNSKTGVVMIISAPSNSIGSLKTEGNGDTAMTSGFSADTFKISATGNGNTAVSVDVGDELSIDFEGNGNFLATGSSGSLSLMNSGNGNVDVFGVQGDAYVDINGNGNTYIGGSANTAITGTKSGFSPLTYTGKSCDVSSSIDFAPGCEQTGGRTPTDISLPSADGMIVSSPKTCVEKGNTNPPPGPSPSPTSVSPASASPASVSPASVSPEPVPSPSGAMSYGFLLYVVGALMAVTLL